jgi:leucyl/phenylalanyl-tRNA--protein transferase
MDNPISFAYHQLHELGHAHSIEVWRKELVGGMYGVAQGTLFCGESMFSRRKTPRKPRCWYSASVFRTAEN